MPKGPRPAHQLRDLTPRLAVGQALKVEPCKGCKGGLRVGEACVVMDGMAHEDPGGQPPTITKIWQLYRVPILLGVGSLFLIAFSVTLLIKSVQTTTPIEFFPSTSSGSGSSTESGSLGEILVDIAGAVVKPGVYNLQYGARVEEAIAAAGGLSSEADLDRIAKTINRAAKLSDGAKLYIPRQSDPQVAGSVTAESGVRVQGTVSVNTASQPELEALPGIGPVTAQKIITNRPYTRLEELVEKKAMSQSLFTKLQGQLSL